MPPWHRPDARRHIEQHGLEGVVAVGLCDLGAGVPVWVLDLGALEPDARRHLEPVEHVDVAEHHRKICGQLRHGPSRVGTVSSRPHYRASRGAWVRPALACLTPSTEQPPVKPRVAPTLVMRLSGKAHRRSIRATRYMISSRADCRSPSGSV